MQVRQPEAKGDVEPTLSEWDRERLQAATLLHRRRLGLTDDGGLPYGPPLPPDAASPDEPIA